MCAFSCLALYNNNILPKSGTTIKTWILELFLLSQAMLIALLYQSGAKIYISFDLWSFPNHYSMLGIIGYFIDCNFKACTILLGLKRLIGSHSRENIAQLLIEAIKTYKLSIVLGFCVLDNAGDNDTSLCVVETFLLTQGVIWSVDSYRLHCFSYIVSLVARAFTANKPLNVAQAKGTSKPPKVL